MIGDQMKKVIIPIICLCLLILTIVFLNPLTDQIAALISNEPKLVIKDGNEYAKDNDYLYVQRASDYIPYSFQDLLNIYYSVINNGWEQFTFYCPKEYSDCLSDIATISKDELILTHLNNYIHPFNSFTNIKTSINENGEINLKIAYLYRTEEKEAINARVDEILANILTDDMDDYDKLKTVHDYIVDNTKYDVERNEESTSEYSSYTAYGPLFEGFATCNGYTDLMAIFLTKLGFNNFKVATTPDEISYSSTGHIWNAVYFEDNWVHIDLTWDDPVSSDGEDYLFHTYFLVSTAAMQEADQGETVIEEHNFNPLFYLGFN